MKVERLDFGRFTKVERTPQGGLRVPAHLTRVGVFVYTRPDGTTVRELRPPEEVFHDDSLSTLAGAPVTDLHPPSPVRPSNWRDLTVGHVSDNVKHDDKFVSAALMIQDADAISKVEREDRRELSCGYTCRLDETPGEWNGERYDAVQRNIRYNHVAIGPRNWGRAGNEVALRLDAQGNQINSTIQSSTNKGEKTVKVIRIDGVEYDFGSEAHINKIEEVHASKLAAETKRADEAEGKLAAETKRADEAEGKLAAATDPKTIDKLVTERADLIADARRILGDDFRSDGKTDREIMIEAIRHDDADFDAEGKSDDYVRAFFDARAIKRHDEGGNGIGAARSAASAAVRSRNDGKRRDDGGEGEVDRFDARAARERMIRDNETAATKPLRFSRSN